jgi:hypothetical protein
MQKCWAKTILLSTQIANYAKMLGQNHFAQHPNQFWHVLTFLHPSLKWHFHCMHFDFNSSNLKQNTLNEKSHFIQSNPILILILIQLKRNGIQIISILKKGIENMLMMTIDVD